VNIRRMAKQLSEREGNARPHGDDPKKSGKSWMHG